MRRVLLLTVVAAAAFAVPVAAAPPATKLTITTWLENDRAPRTYVLTCGPASVRGLPQGALSARDGCRALTLADRKLYRPRLSVHRTGCNYVVPPRRAVIVGHRLGRRVRTTVEVGGCERLLVPRNVLDRFVVWPDEARPG